MATQCVADFCWLHYRLLMRVEDPAARGYYIGDAVSQNWSVRALERQIDSLYFERHAKIGSRAFLKFRKYGSDQGILTGA